jgi:hypothetical protein
MSRRRSQSAAARGQIDFSGSGESGADQDIGDHFYPAIIALIDAKVPFLVGGGYALERFTGIVRGMKDFDIFVRPEDCHRVLETLSVAGYRTELTFPHWLGKAFCGEYYADIIFSSGNGIARVDDDWFKYAVDDDMLGVPIKLCPVEETIWSKAYVMERERYDGADVAHLLLACGESLDWQRLLRRFGSDWRVLLSHIVLFGFAYPSEQKRIPGWVTYKLLQNLAAEISRPGPTEHVCQGTLLSREQYLVDIECRGYKDARLFPRGNLTRAETDQWTAAVREEK